MAATLTDLSQTKDMQALTRGADFHVSTTAGSHNRLSPISQNPIGQTMIQVNTGHAIAKCKAQTITNGSGGSAFIGGPCPTVRGRCRCASHGDRALGVMAQPSLSALQLGRNLGAMSGDATTA